MLVLLLPAVLAHPFAGDLYGHQLRVELHSAELQLSYHVELPTSALMTELREWKADRPFATEPEFFEALVAELQQGLRVEAGGQPLRLELRSVSAAERREEGRFVGLGLVLASPWPEEARQLHLINGNLPDRRAMYKAELWVAPRWVVDACDLLPEAAGGRMWWGQWRAEEAGRELRAALRPRASLWMGLSAGLGSLPLAPARPELLAAPDAQAGKELAWARRMWGWAALWFLLPVLVGFSWWIRRRLSGPLDR
jgi:hypothetical protein